VAPSIDLNVDARLSAGYLPDDEDRIAMYGALAEATGLAQ